MARANRVGDLEVGQDLAYQRRTWAAQRVGWVVLALVLTAALLGIFGSGPLSSTIAGERVASLRIEYARFARLHAPMTLTAHLGPGTVRANETRVWLDRDYLSNVQVERVTPQPERVEAGQDRLVYVFRVAEAAPPTVTVSFDLKPARPGWRSGRAGVDGGQALRFDQFIYP